ncbi:hypothetical protein OIU77_001199 [Salix suchowensis]|uniref:Uncharacterized protein n=1 Tax=Salix suchowensis TaxID=1278906 RepID=A0ABQ9B0L1_9ROSI|nr:hypothetical protein OIU77_001199 [Salix suchowensis]
MGKEKHRGLMQAKNHDHKVYKETGGTELASGLVAVALAHALDFCRDQWGSMCNREATALDPKRGSLGIIAPLAIGLMVGANILVGGPFDGACMNPARAFAPALIGWRWRNHWIYWVGPFLGGGLAVGSTHI